jgi:hypothetical protein
MAIIIVGLFTLSLVIKILWLLKKQRQCIEREMNTMED